ncbi:MAG: trf3, partial [Bryobacterales bacterium]|nr:trf3 [Bryobacterales bacterium]
QWWDDIWLNEAFATWMERKLIDEWKPEWKTRVSDVSAKLGAAEEDSLISARKVRQEILAKDDILNAFDGITYQKGASVIGMFENWMGKEEFRRGVQSYLKQYSWKATTAGQFLDSLSTSSKRDVSKAFSTFLNQAGIPTLAVALDCNGAAKPRLNISQERFLPTGSKGSVNQSWNVPLCLRYGTGTEGQSQCTLLTEQSQSVALEAAKGCPAWVQANDQAVGYYRVEYKGGLLQALIAGDVEKRLSAPERVDLMGNASALADSGKLTAAETLTLSERFHNDPERTVIQTSLDLAMGPAMTLVPEKLQPNYQRFLQKNFQAKAHELGWTPKPGESEDTSLLRPTIVRVIATWGGDKELAAEARVLADKWLADHKAVSPNLVSSVLKTAAWFGDKALAVRFLEALKQEKDKQVRRDLLGSLSSFRDPDAISVGMNALLAGDVPFLEGTSLLFGGQQQEPTRKMALHFLRDNWEQIVAKMPTGGGFDVGAVLPHVGQSYCDVESRDELKTFFRPRVDKFTGAPRALDQTLESVDLCIANKASQTASVAAFLEKY